MVPKLRPLKLLIHSFIHFMTHKKIRLYYTPRLVLLPRNHIYNYTTDHRHGGSEQRLRILATHCTALAGGEQNNRM